MSHSPLLRSAGRVGKAVWNEIPQSVLDTRAFRFLGHCINWTVRITAKRHQTGGTWFFRNMPLLAALTELIQTMHLQEPLRLCFVGCSTGAEVYSTLWMLRTRVPHIRVVTVALDVCLPAIDRAKAGRYLLGSPEFRGAIPDEALSNLFYSEDEYLTVKPWLKEGIRWIVCDARDPTLLSLIGPQDLVLANNFLLHMKDDEASRCMISLIRLIRPGGFLVCRGVDLGVRTNVVRNQLLRPVTAYTEEIHDADPELDARKSWPWHYTSLEPLDKSRQDWRERYAAIFKVPDAAEPAVTDPKRAKAAGG